MPIDVAALERMKKPDYRRINQGLDPDASPVEKAKYKICKNILGYKIDNDFSEQEIGKKLGLKKDKLEYLLFCHIENFNLDELFSYAERLNIPLQVVNEEETPKKILKKSVKTKKNLPFPYNNSKLRSVHLRKK